MPLRAVVYPCLVGGGQGIQDTVFKRTPRRKSPGCDNQVPCRKCDLGELRSAATEPDIQYSRIYREVQEIPYGDTSTYGEIARKLGTSPRLVGLAMKRNPTPLLVPCHRVVAKDGLGGFTPDTGIKEQLQALERKTLMKCARIEGSRNIP
jgi:O-6-methylguanine DNA methyltransferase